MTALESRSRHNRAVRTLVITVVIGLAAVALLVAMVVAHQTTAGVGRRVAAPPDRPSTPAAAGSIQEQELTDRPMLALPAAAAQPHELTTLTAGPELAIPGPRDIQGRWIPAGYPPSPAGALGQLRSIDETGLQDADPATYGRAYGESAQPGAPSVTTSGLYILLAHFRAAAELPSIGPVTGLTAKYTVTDGLIKGTTDNGGYAVVCVLGQLELDSAGRTATIGVGDCQAMRWTGTNWQIAAGPQAAPAPNAWPGTLDAVKAGYRPVRSS